MSSLMICWSFPGTPVWWLCPTGMGEVVCPVLVAVPVQDGVHPCHNIGQENMILPSWDAPPGNPGLWEGAFPLVTCRKWVLKWETKKSLRTEEVCRCGRESAGQEALRFCSENVCFIVFSLSMFFFILFYWKFVLYNGLSAGLLWCGFYCGWLSVCGVITALQEKKTQNRFPKIHGGHYYVKAVIFLHWAWLPLSRALCRELFLSCVCLCIVNINFSEGKVFISYYPLLPF